jgi:hypothetical protein
MGNLVPSKPGGQEKTLDQIFTSGAGPGNGSLLGQHLNSLAMGILPQSMQDLITATTNEQFGHLGARFGTDLGTAISRGLGQAGAEQSLNAMHELFGLGGVTAGFQFNRGENALNRALQEWQTSQQTDLTTSILGALLGG